jgi:hypothetical protein
MANDEGTVTNEQALDLLRVADVTLSKALDKAATPEGKQKILDLMHILMREYGMVLGVDNKGDPYKALTAQFKKSTALIKGIIKNRNTIVKDIQIATEIAQALAPLVAMI